MSTFDVTAILVAVAAVAGYLNHRFLRLPPTSGILLVVLVSSLVLVVAERSLPGRGLRPGIEQFVAEIDLDKALLRGMLCFLLFAGALHVDLAELVTHKWTIAALATVGVILSTAVVGTLTWAVFLMIGVEARPSICFTFGALISPTDPIAVMGLLKELRAPPSLAAQIAGESLFNDGVGVTVFLAVASIAGLASEVGNGASGLNAGVLAAFAARQIIGGVVLGLALGYVSYAALKSINEHSMELLITLALVMFLYTLSFWLHVSGPIAVVVAGLLIGNHGRRFAMSSRTREHVDAFWNMIDDILNAVLFLLLGLEVFAIGSRSEVLVPALLAVPICLFARFISVSIPITAISVGSDFPRGIVPVLAWSGLRGGISVAMVLSLPRFPLKDALLACTYAVVVFSVLVQGLTVRRLLVHYGVGDRAVL